MRLCSWLLPSALVLLTGCSSHSSLPDFTASGYLADRGTVRIWRKNYNDSVHLLTVYTPFSGSGSEETDYRWWQDRLVSVSRHTKGGKPDDVTLRFDSGGKLSFMQRQLAGYREALSDDDVALYQFDAQRMLKLSDALLDGRVMLHQGKRQADGAVMSCQGRRVSPAFDGNARRIISQMQQNSSTAVSIAWLEAPQGTQLLLVSSQDLCASEPQEDDF